ncbi:MAG: hypothetical protein GY738_14655 [Pseudoalteromonas sp.]|nr:hypothetical protein [Pseudoalteromonas sp.]
MNIAFNIFPNYLIKIIFFFFLGSSSAIAIVPSTVEPENVIICHGCNSAERYSLAYQKAQEIGISTWDPLTSTDPESTFIFIFDFETEEVDAFYVSGNYDLANQRPITVAEQPRSYIPASVTNGWYQFSNEFKVAFQSVSDMYIDGDGFEFLANATYRDQVYNTVRNNLDTSFTGVFIGMGSAVQVIGNVTNFVPNHSTLTTLTLNFSNGVSLKIGLNVDGNLTLIDILALNYDYISDTAIFTDADGTQIPLIDSPDDVILDYTISANQTVYEGIISNYDRNGFTISGGFGSGGLSFSNGTYSCNVVREETGETDEDNLPIYIYVFSC